MKTIRELVALWDEDRRDEFEERSAIIEHEGKNTRSNAEGMAYRQMLKEYPELKLHG